MTPDNNLRARRRAVALVILSAIAGYNLVLPVFREELQTYFKLNLEQFGLLLSMGLGVGAVSSLVGGMILERKSISTVTRWTLVGLGCGMCVLAAAKTVYLMVAGLVLVYMFFNPFYLSVQTYLVRAFPDQRRRVISLNLVVFGLASAVLPLWGEFLMKIVRAGVGFGAVLHIPYLFIAAALFAGALFLAVGDPVERSDMGTGQASPKSSVALDASILVLITLTVVHGAGDNALQIWIPRVLAGGSYLTHPLAPGIVASIFSAAYVVSRLILAALPSGFGSRVTMVVPGLLGGGVLLAGILSRSQPLTGAAYILAGFIWSVEYPVMIAAIADTAGKSFARAQAISMVGTGIAAFLLSSVLGTLGAKLGENRLWLVLIPPACCFLFVGIGGMYWLARFGRGGRK